VVYQDIEGLTKAVSEVNPRLTRFEDSCFTGDYVTGDVTSEYLQTVEASREADRENDVEDADANQLDLNHA
jgi:amidophosphoribosyltransferase